MTTPLKLTSLPLFPLHTVLYPDGHLPLRVFEERYRTMVQRCRETQAPFGVVTLLSGHEVQRTRQALEHFHTTGTMASIDSISTMSTGMELLHCTGKDRFRVLDARKLSRGLWVADVELLHGDHAVHIPPYLRHTASALRQVLQKIPKSDLAQASDAQFSDAGWVANRWCELLPMSKPLQLCLLELDSPVLRLEMVADVLDRAGIAS